MVALCVALMILIFLTIDFFVQKKELRKTRTWEEKLPTTIKNRKIESETPQPNIYWSKNASNEKSDKSKTTIRPA